MNFLAHIYLSGDNEDILVGNFIGDFVKGNAVDSYPEDIRKGIWLHRSIDSFTDSHSIVRESKKRLWEKFRHYSAVLVDIFYDHFLAKNWKDYSSTGLKEFTSNFYDIMQRHSETVPETVNQILIPMKEKNWLYNYQFMDGIERSLAGMSRRASFDSGMETAGNSLSEHYDQFEKEFRSFSRTCKNM